MTESHKKSTSESIARDYLVALARLFDQVDMNAFARVVDTLALARNRRATIYLAGNGGSAATAAHWVNDLSKATKCANAQPMRVVSLSDNLSWLTALANDDGYECVFSGQLDNFALEGDVFVVISASGNSKNLVRAVELARDRGVSTIGLLGFDGGKLKDLVDDHLWISTDKGAYELVEDLHMVLCHMLTICLLEKGKAGSSGG